MVSTLSRLFWAFCKVGILGFGGGNAAIPLLEAEAVPHWLSREEFTDLVSINFAFPGVSIVKVAAMVGLRTAGLPGMLVSVVALVLPGLILTIGAYHLLMQYRDHPGVQKLLLAMKFAAVALLATTCIHLLPSGGAMRPAGWLLMGGVFVAVQYWQVSPALALVGAAVVGALLL